MKTVKISLFYQPGEYYIQVMLNKAEQMMELGVIGSMPKITVTQSEKMPNFWHFVLEIEDQDYPFWMGFYEGKNFALNNRPIAVGSKE